MNLVNGFWADRGRSVEVSNHVGDVGSFVAASRQGTVRMSAPGVSVCVQIRGSSRISAREGTFHLKRGDWIAFDRDSVPELQSSRYGLSLGLVLSPEQAGLSPQGKGVFPGRGSMRPTELLIALRLWRKAGESPGVHNRANSLEVLLSHLVGVRSELPAHLGRCPGRSRNRKGQVYGRMQRARLYLEGNAHRIVRLSELAEITSFSSWYVSKTFHSLYLESPHAACLRLRLERACVLLATTSLAISEIGAACGFENACSFARAFRAGRQMTATAYREQCIKPKLARRQEWLGTRAE